MIRSLLKWSITGRGGCTGAAVALSAFFLASLPAAAANLQGLGVVFLHGKGSWAGSFDGGILSSLEGDGAVVAKPEMPWSFHRRYGATFDEAMREVDAA